MVGAFVIGAAFGAFLDFKAVMVFSSVLAASTVVSALVCWWRPGFEAVGWKLGPAACLGNLLFLASAGFSFSEYECLLRVRTGWSCMFAELGPLVAGACCLPPFAGLVWRWWKRRFAA